MKKIIITAVMAFSPLLLFPQILKSDNQILSFLSDSCVYLYHHPIGKKTLFFITNTNKDFYLISLKGKSRNKYYVSLENISSGDAIAWYGWLNRSSIGITFSSDTIDLFEQPYIHSKSRVLIIPLGAIVANVLDYKKSGWMKVSFYINNQFYVGWIPRKYQCNNYFTMCCGA